MGDSFSKKKLNTSMMEVYSALYNKNYAHNDNINITGA